MQSSVTILRCRYQVNHVFENAFNACYDHYLNLIEQRNTYYQHYLKSHAQLIQCIERYTITKASCTRALESLLRVERGVHGLTETELWVNGAVHAFFTNLQEIKLANWLSMKSKKDMEKQKMDEARRVCREHVKRIAQTVENIKHLEQKMRRLEQEKLESDIASYFGKK